MVWLISSVGYLILMIGRLMTGFFGYLIFCVNTCAICLLIIYINNKELTFYSKYACPGFARVNVFPFEWTRFTCWAVPPVYLFARTVNHFVVCKANGTFVVPYWPSVAYWSM